MEQKTSALLLGLLFFTACGQDVSRNALRVTPTINPIVVDPGTDPGSPFGETLGKTSFAVTVNRAKIGIGNEPNENHYALLRTFEDRTPRERITDWVLEARLRLGLDSIPQD